MATVVKDFKIKSGLIVEGTTGTINNFDILTKKEADQTYITNLVGGTGTAENTADTLVKRDGNGDFAAGDITVSEISFSDIGRIYEDDGDLVIASTEEGDDVVIEADDIRLNAVDDIFLTAGSTSDVYVRGPGNIYLVGPAIFAAENEDGLNADKVATHGYVDNAIENIDLTFNSDEITEGTTNLYYTESRAKTDAAELLTGATLTNITITGNGEGLTITAENGVADSDTDDLTEGTTNLYFTDERARNAIGTALTEGANIDITVDGVEDTITVALVGDVVIPTTGSLEVESNDFNVGADSVGLRTSDEYTNAMGVFSMDADDDYAQLVVKNTGSGVNSSSDVIAYANNGDDASGWIDLGITSATFADESFTITGANDGYIFMEAPIGTTGDGNLVLATGANGATNAIVFAAGGLDSDNTQMTITPDESVRIVIDTPSTSPSTGALIVDGGVGIQGDVNIQGNITFGGEGTSLTTENLAVTDPLIYVGDQNAGDAVDMGIVTEYKDGATTKFAGVVRDASDGVFKIFSDATTKPTSTVNFSEAGLEYGDLKVDALEANSANLTNVTIGMVDETEIAHLNGVTSGIQGQIDAKQDELTAGSNIDITGATISVTGLDAADISDFNTAALSATAAAYDAAGTAAQEAADALQDAKDYADALDTDDVAEGSTNLYFTNQRAIDAVGGTIEDQIDLLDTDDIEEGASNQYFTDSRAKDSAADLLTNATLTNITITGTGAGLTITAESGVADATTDDLAEGEDNLYFTDERVIDAVDNAVINPQAVEVNMVARQVASTLEAATAGIQVGHSFAKADYRSAEFLVKVAYGTHTEISKVLLTLDTSDNIAITEYGIVGTNGSASSISADVSGDNVRLLVTTSNNNSTVTVMGTLLV
jgi:formylmethanofuran dehydrogenase subunit D